MEKAHSSCEYFAKTHTSSKTARLDFWQLEVCFLLHGKTNLNLEDPWQWKTWAKPLNREQPSLTPASYTPQSKIPQATILFIGFLPKTGPTEGGTLGSFKFGRQTKQELLTTKYTAMMNLWPLLERVLWDARHGRIDDGVSTVECAIQRLNAFDAAMETEETEYGRAMSEIFLVAIENEFPDKLVVEQGEPGSSYVVS